MVIKVNERVGIKPAKIDKNGELFDVRDVNNFIVKRIVVGDYFNDMGKIMTTDAKKAIELLGDVEARIESGLDRFIKTHHRFAAESKKASGSVRDSASKLAEGLLRIEKSANFDRLERYVDLLERAAKAMDSLAELEKTGKLEKIANAIK